MTLEEQHADGLTPDRYYYQLNGKSAGENYRDQKKKKKTEKRRAS